MLGHSQMFTVTKADHSEKQHHRVTQKLKELQARGLLCSQPSLSLISEGQSDKHDRHPNQK